LLSKQKLHIKYTMLCLNYFQINNISKLSAKTKGIFENLKKKDVLKRFEVSVLLII